MKRNKIKDTFSAILKEAEIEGIISATATDYLIKRLDFVLTEDIDTSNMVSSAEVRKQKQLTLF